MLKRILVAFAVFLALVIGVVPAFANGPNGSTDGETAAKGGGEILSCPKANGPGNDDAFNVGTYWVNMFAIQRATPGVISVRATFNSGSAAVRVRLYNIQTNFTTNEQVLSSSSPTSGWAVACGDWVVMIKSTQTFTHASGQLWASP